MFQICQSAFTLARIGLQAQEKRGPYLENVRNLGGGTPIINGPLSCEWHLRVGSNWPLLTSPG